MFFSGPWHLGLLKEAGGADFEDKWAVAPMPKKVTRDLVRRRQQPRRVQGQRRTRTPPGRSSSSCPIRRRRSLWYNDVDRPAGGPGGLGRPDVEDDPNVAMFGEQLKDTKAPPVSPTWCEISAAINDALEKMTTGDETPQEAADEMQQKAESIGTELR